MQTKQSTKNALGLSREEILRDYRLGWESRHASLLGRKEVFMGKAKFGIFGDGKELPQLAMAKVFRNGDFRSGYYRDQTFMFAIGQLTVQQYFAQLYAHMDVEAEPASAGRMMNGHFATRSLDANGEWVDLMAQKNSSADISPTAGQMPRLLGLAYASKLYRQNKALHSGFEKFTKGGNEVAFGTIGDASTSEGIFFETLNAAGVLQVPMIMNVWDDGYGISVPKKYQTTKADISKMLAGLQRKEDETGYEIIRVKGWDYVALVEAYRKAEKVAREEHVPVLIHVLEVTQPQGHSTSGSHERYKSKERLEWEAEFDGLKKFGEWIIAEKMATEAELEEIQKEASKAAKDQKNVAWKAFVASMKDDHNEALQHIAAAAEKAATVRDTLTQIHADLKGTMNPIRLDAIKAVKKALRSLRHEPRETRRPLNDWLRRVMAENEDRFSSHLHSQSAKSALAVQEIPAQYAETPESVDGRVVLQHCFDENLAKYPEMLAFGEDVGHIGDVNQAFAGLQEKHGILRVQDTGIREATILGQGIGLAMRGLRPIAEIQYLDYLLYAIQIMSDDLATVQYRTKGGQKAPLIIRTRGHRLEGIWHSGSPIGMILNAIRGIYVLTPRNMTQAAGMYNTMLKSDDTALIIECLNGYRLKEDLPTNVSEFTVPLGVPEVLREGEDVTLVTYGSMCRIAMEAAEQLAEVGISLEVIDAQTLLPFDRYHEILKSVKKTNRVVFADEDVPGGATAYMMQKVVDEQGAYRYLDSQPRCVAAKPHRPAYTSDGDYFSKPSAETLFDEVYALMQEAEPQRFPKIYE